MKATLAQRFWAKVQKTDTCWIWTAYRNTNGYGVIGRGARGEGNVLAHRLAYELHVGPVPDGMHLDHTCHRPACVNPAHLRAVSRELNMQNRAGANVNSRTGIRGVARDITCDKYRVRFMVNGAIHDAGLFRTLAEAEVAAEDLRLRVMPDATPVLA